MTNKIGKSTWIVLVLLTLFPFSTLRSQQLNDTINSTRMNTLLISSGVAYSASLIALNNLWYSDHPKQDFHFFDDSGEWQQMDKLGHFYSTFQLSSAGSRAFIWTGMNGRKSALWGSVLGMAMMLPIEIMDGFSSEYGASGSDLLSNFLGAGFFLGQEILWKETRIHPKFSFSHSGIADLRPEVLGKNRREEIFKDYNGQTIWLSFDLHSLSGIKLKWLNIALGYGVENMINGSGTPINGFTNSAFRQYYIGIDFDLSHIHSSSKAINTLLYFVNLIHLPAPALEYNNQDKFTFHPLKF